MENFECASECNHLKIPLLYRIIENYRIIKVGKTVKIIKLVVDVGLKIVQEEKKGC